MSTFITPLRDLDSSTAPEPCAAMLASRLSPALTATKRPASSANNSAMARALSRSSATPVRISAPVSTCSRESPAAGYWRSTNSPSARCVDGRGADVRRQQDVRLVQHLTVDGDVAIVLALELQTREQQVRGGRADIDADADQDDAVLLCHVAGRGGERHRRQG